MILTGTQLNNLRAQVTSSEQAHYDLVGLNLNDAKSLLDTIADLQRQLRERGATPGDVMALAERIQKECWRSVDRIASSFATSRCAELIDAYVQERVGALERENHRLRLNLVEPTIQLRINRAVLAESKAIADRWNGFTKSRLPFETWLFERLAANEAKVGEGK